MRARETIKRVLGIDDSSEYVLAQLEITNRNILRYESIFITMLAFLTLVSTLFPFGPWLGKTADTLVIYRLGMLFIGIASIACHIVCMRLSKRESSSSNATRLVLISYTTVLLISAIALTAFDYINTNSLFIYVVVLVLIFGLLYIQPFITIVLNVVYGSILAIALMMMGVDTPTSYLALGAYSFIVVAVSISNYQTRRRATEASEEVRNVSRHDSLTGVKNRHAIIEDTPKALGRQMFLLLGDIDEFKFYNDSFGHNAGDKLLQAFAESMCGAFGRPNVYRYGGDEFIAIVADVDGAAFRNMVVKWRRSFAGVEVDGERYVPTTSGGYVSGSPQTVEELQDMLRLADIRLYDAKRAGRNKVLGMEYEGREAAAAKFDAERLRERRSGDTDSLTGLPSMMYFLNHANSLLDSPALKDKAFYLVYFNIENMKAYNERFGIARGDELIVFTARAIEGAFPHSLVTRVGDDRFATLTYSEDPVEGIERVHEAVRTYNSSSNTVVRAGIYEYQRGMEISSACDRAKLACDRIRGHHNVYHCVFDEHLHEVRERKQLVLDRFESALEHGYIHAYYQPVVRSMSERISEFEALARWIDPEDGMVMPGEFVPVLEEHRIIHELDLRVIECVCRDIRMLTDEGLRPLPVSVNLSRYDMTLCDIVDETAQIMSRYNIPPNMLIIELTESAFSENTELLRTTIERFHDLGMQVWMDDFGSGYSSLNILREFDFDLVKLDMLFLRHRDERSHERTHMMIPHLVNMAKELSVQTLAEGVETEEQRQFLSSVGCEKLQGYVFEKPAPVEYVREMLAKGEGVVEMPEERAYYDPIGHVSLATPMAIDPDLAHSVEMSGGIPAAIVEFREGRVGYLHWNSSYLDYLKDIGMYTIENSTAQMNDLSRPQSQGFFQAAARQRGKEGWATLSFYEGNDLCTGMGRCVAIDEEGDAVAFLYIAFNVTHYLARAGLSLPERLS